MLPFGPFEEMGKQNMALFEQAMKMLSPYGHSAATEKPPAAEPTPAPAEDAPRLKRLETQLEALTKQLDALTKKS
jgi:polyhydroxyalkanoate synthesis regulator protein